MRLLSTLILINVIIHTTVARCKRPRPNPVMGAIQNILSPSNAERTMQMIKMATAQTLGNPIAPCGNPPPPILTQYPSPKPPCNFPVDNFAPIGQSPFLNPWTLPNPSVQIPSPMQLQLSNPLPVPLQLPNPMLMPMPGQLPCPMPMPPPVQMPMPVPSPGPMPMPNPLPMPMPSLMSMTLPDPMPMPMPMPSQMPMPTPMQLPSPMPVQMPSPMPAPIPSPMPMLSILQALQPPEIVIEPNPCPCLRELIYPAPETIPNYLWTPPAIPQTPEVLVPIPLTPAEDTYSCPIPTPAALFNPCLPVASPVSGWTQENMPSATSCTRSQYLRKVPIPPPTL